MKFSLVLYIKGFGGDTLLGCSTLYEAIRIRDIILNSKFSDDSGVTLSRLPSYIGNSEFYLNSRKRTIAWYNIDPKVIKLQESAYFQFLIRLQLDHRVIGEFNNFLKTELVNKLNYLVLDSERYVIIS